jgi:hypothetical protein
LKLVKSPFLIVQDFLSPLTCERLLNDNLVKAPDVNPDGDPIKLERHVDLWEKHIVEQFRGIVDQLEERYDCQYRGLERPLLQYYPENAKAPAEPPGCENSRYVRRKWVKVADVDLVGYVWLKDFNSQPPLDPRHEVFGGKLEFPVYNFSLVPQRGTLVLFPAGPHFITVISPVLVGDLYQLKLRVSVRAKNGGLWLYQPANFQGTWQEWFEGYF